MFQHSLAERTVPVPVPGKQFRRFRFRVRFLGKRFRRFRFPVPVPGPPCIISGWSVTDVKRTLIARSVAKKSPELRACSWSFDFLLFSFCNKKPRLVS